DIDGLRAIAVLLILMFHAGFEWASGGYVGVDVFFVISGFLITRNIKRELDLQQFSFTKFYQRRIKRLFPALFATLIITFVCGYFIFSPVDLERLGLSIQYAVLSISNFFFWQESGYFNTGSEIKPLLHTWSLAVEEQFYLIWPALIVAVSLLKKPKALLLFLIIACLISLILNVLFLSAYPSMVFFHLPFRIFEFALGALCALMTFKNSNNPLVINTTSVIGILMILYAFVTFDQNTQFPGINALLPCLGTVLIIQTRCAGINQYILSFRIMVKIGLISYSVYLIHWPLMVFYKYWKFSDIILYEQIALIIVSLILGLLMWKFIEKPFRYRSKPQSTVRFYLKFMFLIVGVLSLGYLTQYKKGWPQRIPQEFFMSQEERSKNLERYWKDFTQLIKKQDVKKAHKHTIVMGNSHAVDLIYSFIENDAELYFTFFNTWFKCFNFGTAIYPQDNKICDEKRTRYFKNPAWKKADVIYLHDNWAVLDLNDLNKRLNQIRNLSQAPIYVFGPKMTYTKPIPAIALSHMRMSSLNQYSQQFSNFEFLNKVNSSVKKMVENSKISDLNYIDILSIQCGSNIDNCQIVSDENNKFLYFDKDHFTSQGAQEFGQKLQSKYPSLFQ
ncbi:MAG: acyltransferase family protein, partial [Marinicellaceae bacterium]